MKQKHLSADYSVLKL